MRTRPEGQPTGTASRSPARWATLAPNRIEPAHRPRVGRQRRTCERGQRRAFGPPSAEARTFPASHCRRRRVQADIERARWAPRRAPPGHRHAGRRRGVDAPGWFAPETVTYLCSTEPPPLPEPGPDRDGWTPGAPCHDSGRSAAPDGLTSTLPLDALSEAERPIFDAAADWYLLLIEVEGTRRPPRSTPACRRRSGPEREAVIHFDDGS